MFVFHLARDRPLLGPAEVPWLEEAVKKLDMIQQSAQKMISPREVKMWGLSIQKRNGKIRAGYCRCEKVQGSTIENCFLYLLMTDQIVRCFHGLGNLREAITKGHLKTSGSLLQWRNACALRTWPNKGQKRSEMILLPSCSMGMAGNDSYHQCFAIVPPPPPDSAY